MSGAPSLEKDAVLDLSEVKPCPFCKSGPESGCIGLGYKGQPATHFFVGCVKCAAHGPEIEGQDSAIAWREAVRKWNKAGA